MTIPLRDSPDEPAATNGGLVVPLQAIRPARSAALERVYAAHYRDVYRYVLALTRSAEDAEDITADTFERALRTWSDAPDRPIAWLLLTARRIATDRWRRARRLARILVAGARPVDGSASPPADPEFEAWWSSLSAVLTARQREVLVLRYQRDLTDAEIAAVMGLTESGVRSLVSRALAVLRSHPELL